MTCGILLSTQRAKYFYPEKSISSVQDSAVNVSTCQLELSASLGPRADEMVREYELYPAEKGLVLLICPFLVVCAAPRLSLQRT